MEDAAATWSEVVALADTTDFSGVVRLETGSGQRFELAQGDADRRHQVAVDFGTAFGVASATKGLTALAIVSLIESGVLRFDTTLRSLVGDLLPLVDEGVTIAHLLAHRSGVGDYLDEDAAGDVDDYVLGVAPHELLTAHDYAVLMVDLPQVFAPGERFAYNNGGYIMLAMVIENIAGSFHETVVDRVLKPAGMDGAGFFRSDELPPQAAVGYTRDGRTNVLHLPIIGSGDGGIYLTLDDVTALWCSLHDAAIVSAAYVAEMTTVRSNSPKGAYGLGFWLSNAGELVELVGQDVGVSFRSASHRTTRANYVVMSNTSSGAWPLARLLEPIIAG